MAATLKQADQAFKHAINCGRAKYPKATAKLEQDREDPLQLRLPGRAQGESAHHQPDRVQVRHHVPPHPSNQQRCFPRHRPRFDLQGDLGRGEDLASHPCFLKVAELLGVARYEDGLRCQTVHP